jgi:hypothetical protein
MSDQSSLCDLDEEDECPFAFSFPFPFPFEDEPECEELEWWLEERWDDDISVSVGDPDSDPTARFLS